MPKCPKCNGKMNPCEDGLSCLNCGHIQYDKIASTKPARGSYGPLRFRETTNQSFPPEGALPDFLTARVKNWRNSLL